MNLTCRCPKGYKKRFLEKASFSSDKLVQSNNPEIWRQWIQQDYISISKLLVWDIWPFFFARWIASNYCCSFLFLVHSTKLEDYLRCVNMVFPPRCGHLPHVEHRCRPWRWLKKLWSETGPSSPGERSSELLEIFPQKVHRDDGRLGCFFGWWAFGLFLMIYINSLGIGWRVLFNFWDVGLIYLLQMEIKPLCSMAFFRSCLHPTGISFMYFSETPDGAAEGAETSLTALALLQGLKNCLKVPWKCRALSVRV